MKSLIKGIAQLPKRYAKILFAKLGALLILFAILILLTIFFAYMMIAKWQVAEWVTFVVCFAPWLLALIAFIVAAAVNTTRLEQEKQELFDLGRQQFFVQAIGLVLGFLNRRKTKKARAKKIDAEDEQ